ncbi:MAG: bifunctional oligoribonuclease/PAP phosphatase NrnA [Patescibacteria group bacterium]|jgi:phosphoesterase RecJ-like protein
METNEQRQRKLFELLTGYNRLLLACHQKPDGDTLGAGTALAHWLKGLGKEVTLFCLDKPGQTYAFLDHSGEFTNDPSIFASTYDAIVVLDSGTLAYAGVHKLIDSLSGDTTVINIDHHKSNAQFGHFNLVDETASSTSEIIADFFKVNNQKLDASMATSLMTGIMNDTAYFTNAATNIHSLELTSEFLTAGARSSEVAKAMFKNKDAKTLNLWGSALARLKHNSRLNLAFTYLKQEDLVKAGAKPGATEGLINFLNAICGGAETIMVLTQADDNLIKGSFRSVRTDVARLAKLFGGGGHKLAAGFTIAGRIVETEKGIKII